ncbi:unnamed protein product, partial [Ilex paraguariensis]
TYGYCYCSYISPAPAIELYCKFATLVLDSEGFDLFNDFDVHRKRPDLCSSRSLLLSFLWVSSETGSLQGMSFPQKMMFLMK